MESDVVRKHRPVRLFLLTLLLAAPIAAQAPVSKVWVADNRDGTYRNPILHADYSDPDVIRVGDDFYLVASSFNAAPGLPILHSRDLVNWTIISHALPRQPPSPSGQMDWGEGWHLRSRQRGCVRNGIR